MIKGLVEFVVRASSKYHELSGTPCHRVWGAPYSTRSFKCTNKSSKITNSQVHRDIAFGAHAILLADCLWVDDASMDERACLWVMRSCVLAHIWMSHGERACDWVMANVRVNESWRTCVWMSDGICINMSWWTCMSMSHASHGERACEWVMANVRVNESWRTCVWMSSGACINMSY